MGIHSCAAVSNASLSRCSVFRTAAFSVLMFATVFQLSCSGCSEEESGKNAITDTEQVRVDTTVPSDTVSTDSPVADSDTDEISTDSEINADSDELAAPRGSAVGIVAGGAHLQTSRYLLNVTVGDVPAATVSSSKYQLTVGAGAQVKR